MDYWEWPQYTVAILMMVTLVLYGVLHGERPTWNYNVGGKIVGTVIMIFILYKGGFF